MEIIRKRRKYGGFTGNTANTIGCLGLKPTLIGFFGKTSLDPAFVKLMESCTLVPIGDPAINQILEFGDGKIMLAHLKELEEFNWTCLTGALDIGSLKSYFTDADIVALGYWASMPAFDEVLAEICRHLLIECNTRMFFDFADLRIRSREALIKTLDLIGELNQNTPMTLSLNESEAEFLFSRFGATFSSDIDSVEKSLKLLRRKIGINEIIVHTPYFAAGANVEESASMPQFHCEKAVITTGAGDTFNGGYLTADLGNLNLENRLAIANAATFFYITNGYAPDSGALIKKASEIKARIK
ncbi:MAG: carbohydrate kinase family protein [Clostridiales bacterium]|nr:carbohydrate kinase family protein [Clostridiales bacterium]